MLFPPLMNNVGFEHIFVRNTHTTKALCASGTCLNDARPIHKALPRNTLQYFTSTGVYTLR